MLKYNSIAKKLVLVVGTGLLAINASACIGKGKGKAPPPVAAPLVTKG